jgi:hypothetical protein
VRIILAASDFSAELITSVLWLNKHGLDITCVRLKPYKLDGRVLIDATQIVPLPEAANYEIRIRDKEDKERKVKSARQEIFRRFWSQWRTSSTSLITCSKAFSSTAWKVMKISLTG